MAQTREAIALSRWIRARGMDHEHCDPVHNCGFGGARGQSSRRLAGGPRGAGPGPWEACELLSACTRRPRSCPWCP